LQKRTKAVARRNLHAATAANTNSIENSDGATHVPLPIVAAILPTLLGFLLCLVAVFLILLILVQRGRGGGLAGALGGMGGSSAFGAKAGDVFTRITIVAATIWILLCIAAARIGTTGESRLKVRGPAGGAAVGAAADTDAEKGAATTPAAPAAGTPATAPVATEITTPVTEPAASEPAATTPAEPAASSETPAAAAPTAEGDSK
jgi:preprotein translocase subunit SecG